MEMCAIFKCGEPVYESMSILHIPCWCGHSMEEGEMDSSKPDYVGRKPRVSIGLCEEHFTSITEIWKFETDDHGAV